MFYVFIQQIVLGSYAGSKCKWQQDKVLTLMVFTHILVKEKGCKQLNNKQDSYGLCNDGDKQVMWQKQKNKGGAAPGNGVQRGLCVLCPEGVTVALLLKGGVDGTKVDGANETGKRASMQFFWRAFLWGQKKINAEVSGRNHSFFHGRF